jgi:hypothetical protein
MIGTEERTRWASRRAHCRTRVIFSLSLEQGRVHLVEAWCARSDGGCGHSWGNCKWYTRSDNVSIKGIACAHFLCGNTDCLQDLGVRD